jgi:hypothetical protein
LFVVYICLEQSVNTSLFSKSFWCPSFLFIMVAIGVMFAGKKDKERDKEKDKEKSRTSKKRKVCGYQASP